jgi:phosphoglycolate phosphatase-like HAD superfamily hydrolase
VNRLSWEFGLRSTKLFLFDIDGTLLRRAGPAHRVALERAVSKYAGFAVTTEGIDTGGALDRDILRLMLSRAGVAEKRIREWMPGIVLEAQRVYPSLCPDLRHRLAPGMRAFLHRLERAGIPKGLVTGNLSRIGWHKMTRAGIRGHFSFGAFAEMGRTRTELVARALRQAPRHTHAYLVGDHLNDIRAARENGIPVISVATGPMTREELAAFAPDYLLDSIEGLPPDILER